ncbi:C-type lectin domain family 4 member F-like [Coregonus clupeaformis]|uniref:C-type lectin domain family 4 member F-like n=1 Tax=Coregonus clupeaformis TaxID=59861 RepID=UPI001E1C55A2|nr:C-type lectin domain family 4 member F-like [Coregonus clupeaformis]
MPEELQYSTVVLKNPNFTSPKVKEGLFLVKDGPPPHSQPFRGVAVCLGVLCVLLVLTSIPFCVYFSTSLSEHNTNLVKELEQLTDDHISLLAANQDLMNLYCKLSEANHILQSDYINVSTENQQLKAERMNLSRDRDGLNWTLGVIFQLKKFPVDNYCPYKDANIKVPFGHLWRTWQGSRQHCKNNNADLVDIDSQEEQEFILNNTQAYYDEDHGYWIGLTDIAEDGQWLWVDGRHQNLTDGFWKRQPVWGRDCALTNPNNAPLANWNAASCGQRNRWICESRALIWSG